MNNKTHRALFKGERLRKIYKLRHGVFNLYYIEEDSEVIEHIDLERAELNKPILTEGESIHLSSLDKVVDIKAAVRSTDNSMIYFADYVIEMIEDDITEKTREEAEKKLEKCMKEWGEKHTVKKKWWQFWKKS